MSKVHIFFMYLAVNLEYSFIDMISKVRRVFEGFISWRNKVSVGKRRLGTAIKFCMSSQVKIFERKHYRFSGKCLSLHFSVYGWKYAEQMLDTGERVYLKHACFSLDTSVFVSKYCEIVRAKYTLCFKLELRIWAVCLKSSTTCYYRR